VARLRVRVAELLGAGGSADDPSLPPQARQPSTQTPCLPSGSAALTTELEAWLQILTPLVSQDSPVSAPTTR